MEVTKKDVYPVNTLVDTLNKIQLNEPTPTSSNKRVKFVDTFTSKMKYAIPSDGYTVLVDGVHPHNFSRILFGIASLNRKFTVNDPNGLSHSETNIFEKSDDKITSKEIKIPEWIKLLTRKNESLQARIYVHINGMKTNNINLMNVTLSFSNGLSFNLDGYFAVGNSFFYTIINDKSIFNDSEYIKLEISELDTVDPVDSFFKTVDICFSLQQTNIPLENFYYLGVDKTINRHVYYPYNKGQKFYLACDDLPIRSNGNQSLDSYQIGHTDVLKCEFTNLDSLKNLETSANFFGFKIGDIIRYKNGAWVKVDHVREGETVFSNYLAQIITRLKKNKFKYSGRVFKAPDAIDLDFKLSQNNWKGSANLFLDKYVTSLSNKNYVRFLLKTMIHKTYNNGINTRRYAFLYDFSGYNKINFSLGPKNHMPVNLEARMGYYIDGYFVVAKKMYKDGDYPLPKTKNTNCRKENLIELSDRVPARIRFQNISLYDGVKQNATMRIEIAHESK